MVNGDHIPQVMNEKLMWTVEKAYNLSTSTNGTSLNMTFMNPGDRTIFIVSRYDDVNSSHWAENGLDYWTSPMYIVGNDPLPGAASRKLPWVMFYRVLAKTDGRIKAGLMLGVLAASCLLVAF